MMPDYLRDINTCAECVHFRFGKKLCVKKNPPLQLIHSITDRSGFVHLLTPKECPGREERGVTYAGTMEAN